MNKNNGFVLLTMHEIKINVIKAIVLKSQVKGISNMIFSMKVIPKLSDN
jgi:hypothetical protein